jgi:glyceraldehyde-3-phosphate dehydrogenase/erythrose-4-phosphate dehydrogenase
MTRVAINGLGRIGRNFLRASLECRPNFEVVALAFKMRDRARVAVAFLGDGATNIGVCARRG